MEKKKPNSHQLAVGKCPKCNTYPDWFNDMPLKAYCFKDECPAFSEDGPEGLTFMFRVVPPEAQPYNEKGNTWNSRWVWSKSSTPGDDRRAGIYFYEDEEE